MHTSPFPPRRRGIRAPALSRAQWSVVAWGLIAMTTALQFGSKVVANWRLTQWEDPLFIEHVASMNGLGDALGRASVWTGIYRPLSTNVVFLLGRAFGHSLPLYHTAVLVVYLANAALFFEVARKIVEPAWALLAVGLFCSRAANTETLLYTTQLQTTLPCSFALLSVLVVLSPRPVHFGRRLMSLGSLCALALLSKEQMVVLPVVVLATAVARSRLGGTPLPRRELGAIALVLGLVVSVWWVLARRHLSVADNPWWTYDFGLAAVLRNYAAYLASFSNILVHPVALHDPAVLLDDFAAVGKLAAWTWPAVGLTLGVSSVALVLDRRRLDRKWVAVWLGVVWLGAFLAPVVVFVNRRLMYYGYAGHLGTSLALVGLLALAWERFGRWRERRAEAEP